MARRAIFVDAENVFYSQKQFLHWFFDWEKLLSFLSKGHDVVDRQFFTIKATFKDDRISENRKKFHHFLTTALHFYVRERETKTIRLPNGASFQKSNIDIEIAIAILTTVNNWDEIVFVGGDSDFAILFQKIRDMGKKVIIVSTKETVSYDLRNVAHEFIDLDSIKSHIERVEKK